MRAEYVVSSGNTGMGAGLDGSVPDRLEALDQVDEAVGVRLASALVDGEGRALAGVDMAAADAVMDLDVQEGSLAAVGADGIAVSSSMAEDKGWELGSTVPVTFADGVEHRVTVEAIRYTDNAVVTVTEADVVYVNVGPDRRPVPVPETGSADRGPG